MNTAPTLRVFGQLPGMDCWQILLKQPLEALPGISRCERLRVDLQGSGASGDTSSNRTADQDPGIHWELKPRTHPSQCNQAVRKTPPQSHA